MQAQDGRRLFQSNLVTRATEPAVNVVLAHLEKIQGLIGGYIDFHADSSGSLIVLFVCSVIQ